MPADLMPKLLRSPDVGSAAAAATAVPGASDIPHDGAWATVSGFAPLADS